jgi:hypothetical protein
MIRQSRFIEEEIINQVKVNFIVNNLLPPVMEKGLHKLYLILSLLYNMIKFILTR